MTNIKAKAKAVFAAMAPPVTCEWLVNRGRFSKLDSWRCRTPATWRVYTDPNHCELLCARHLQKAREQSASFFECERIVK